VVDWANSVPGSKAAKRTGNLAAKIDATDFLQGFIGLVLNFSHDPRHKSRRNAEILWAKVIKTGAICKEISLRAGYFAFCPFLPGRCLRRMVFAPDSY
jgi:hypothetical protein